MTRRAGVPSSAKRREEIVSEVKHSATLGRPWLIYRLGGALREEWAPEGVAYMADYRAMGRELWAGFRYDLYRSICSDRGKLRVWAEEAVAGDVRNFVLGVVSAVASTYNVSLGIAIPVAALLLKSGLKKYCAARPRKPAKSVRQLLLSERLYMKSEAKELGKLTRFLKKRARQRDSHHAA